MALPDCLVIGGGLIGCLSAYELARGGARVAVVERGELGREASWAGAGILSPMFPWRYPDGLSALVNRSLTRYATLVPELRELSGIDPERRLCGLLIPVLEGEVEDDLDEALPWSARFGWRCERLDREAARAVEPALTEGCAGGVWWPEVGQIRNPRLAAAARRACAAVGVELLDHREVTGFRRTGERIAAVATDQGELAAGHFVLAAGAWSQTVAGWLDLDLPVTPVKGQILLLRAEPNAVRRIVKHESAYVVPRADGRILVGATMERAGFDKETTLWAMRSLANGAVRLLPVLDGAVVERQWAGLRPGTADGLPFLGPAPGIANLTVAAGHYRNGVVLAAATGEAVAALVTGQPPATDLTPFAVSRPAAVDHPLGLPAAT